VLEQRLGKHPLLRITDKQIDIHQADIDLAKQDYKPGWALSASYGYRDDAPTGMERSDFFSVGVSFDIPVFTSNRQDKTVSAASSRKQAMSIDYQLLHKKLLSQALKTQSEIERLAERSSLYQDKLLKQAHEQAEASLSAYTNDDGDFADVMRAYIAELNSKIEALEINIKQRKALATMEYLLAGENIEVEENSYEYE
jgi:outer membrane protein TolC